MSSAQDQPSPEELRAYLESVRDAEPAEIIAQAFTVLGTGAEVKLGRSDARVLIDAMAALAQAVQGRVPAQLSDGMNSGVAQLQSAQVQAEAEQKTAAEGAGGQQVAGSTPGAGPAAGGQQQAPGGAPPPPTGEQPGGEQDSRMTDRLWIPGRGQPPA